jgi:hypothetical protein
MTATPKPDAYGAIDKSIDIDGKIKVAVVTAYYDEDKSVLKKTADSVQAQTFSCTHIMVADGHPNAIIDDWPAKHIKLPWSHRDCGDTPRSLGAQSALSQGFDAVAFLDAGNWYYPQHIETMVRATLQTGAQVCTGTRSLHRTDGSFMYVDPSSVGPGGADTNCLFLSGEALMLVPILAAIPREVSLIGDRVLWKSILARPSIKRVHVATPTVAYTTMWRIHYKAINESPPEFAKESPQGDVFSAWQNTWSPREREFWNRWIFNEH